MEPGEKYMSGELDLGAIGAVKILIFDNSHKKEEKHPDKIVYLARGDEKPKKIGALWVNTKKVSEELPVVALPETTLPADPVGMGQL